MSKSGLIVGQPAKLRPPRKEALLEAKDWADGNAEDRNVLRLGYSLG